MDRQLGECKVCGKIFARDLLGPKDLGTRTPIVWDARPRTCAPGQAGRGLTAGTARLGLFPEWKRATLANIVLACRGCGGAVAPPPQPPIWKASNSAWLDWQNQDGGAEWVKMAPLHLKRKMGFRG